ncbi:MAG: GNAT family N-acetyltransferase [Sphingobium sp.]
MIAAVWRPMTAGDIADVARISCLVHGAYGEEAATYAERLRLFPAGCFVLIVGGAVVGFLVCHPWHCGSPPALNALLGAIPVDAGCLYLHDLALLASVRGTGSGRAATAIAVEVARAEELATIRLVAVNGAESFWSGQGFGYLAGEGAEAAFGEGAYFMERCLKI